MQCKLSNQLVTSKFQRRDCDTDFTSFNATCLFVVLSLFVLQCFELGFFKEVLGGISPVACPKN